MQSPVMSCNLLLGSFDGRTASHDKGMLHTREFNVNWPIHRRRYNSNVTECIVMQSRPSANHNLAITNHALTPVKASLSASSQSPVYLPVSINLFPIGAADSENQNPII